MPYIPQYNYNFLVSPKYETFNKPVIFYINIISVLLLLVVINSKHVKTTVQVVMLSILILTINQRANNFFRVFRALVIILIITQSLARVRCIQVVIINII